MTDLDILEQEALDAVRARDERIDDELSTLTFEEMITGQPKTRGWFKDSAAALITGPMKALKSLAPIGTPILNLHLRAWGLFGVKQVEQGQVEDAAERIIQAVGPAETKPGRFIESAAQFLSAFIPVSRAIGAAKILQASTTGGRVTQSVVASAVASGLAFEGHEGNLANLVQQYPTLQNPITEFLAVEGDDSEAEARLKNALADAAVGVPIEGFLAALRALRAQRRAKLDLEAEGKADEIGAPDLGKVKSQEPETPKALEAPEEKIAQEAAAAGDSTKKEIEQTAPVRSEPETPKALEAPEEKIAQEAAAAVDSTKKEIEVLAEAEKITGKPDSPYAAQGESATIDELSEKLGIDEARLAELRGKIESGEVKPEEVGKLLNFNPERVDWSKIGDAQDVVGLMNAVSRVFADALGKAGGKRVSLEAINSMAGKLGMSLEGAAELWQRTRGRSGQGIAAEFLAARNLMYASAKHLKNLATAIRNGIAAPDQVLGFLTHLRRHATLQAVIKGSQAEIARALRAMSIQAKANEAAFRIANGKAIKRRKELEAKVRKLEEAERKARAAADRKRAERAKAEGKEPPKPSEPSAEAAPAEPVKVDHHPALTMQDVQEVLRDSGMTWNDILALCDEIAQMSDEEAINAAARRTTWEKFRDGVVSLYVNNLLSGVPTFTINLVPALFRAFIEAPLERYGAAALATLRRGSVDRYEWILANKAALATYTNSWNALKLAAKAFREGLPQTDAAVRAEVSLHNEALPGTLGKIIQLPSRIILTIDEVFKHLSYQQELTSRAVEVAAEVARTAPKSKQDAIFKNVFEEILRNPTDDLVADAISRARYDTYQAALESKFSNTLLYLTSQYPLLKLIMPFIKTPANIMKQAILERTPLALARKSIREKIKAGGREGNEALLRVIVGSSAMGIAMYMAATGRITGPRKGKGQNRNSADMAGPPPDSVRFGDRWYQFNRLDPIGTVLALAAAIVEIASDPTPEDALKEQTVWTLFANASHIVTENITDKVYFKGLSDLLEALNSDNATQIQRYIEEKAAALVPFSSFSRSMARQHDQFAREAFDFVDKLKAQSPWFNHELPPRRDYFGRPIRHPERLGPDWASPFIVGEKDPDPVVQEFAKLRKRYQMPDRNIDGISALKMTSEQYSRYLEVRGQYIYAKMQEAISSGRWARMNRGEKLDLIADAERAGTKKAKKTLKREFPDIKQKLEKYEDALEFLESLPE